MILEMIAGDEVAPTDPGALAATAALTTSVTAQTLSVGDEAPKFEGK